MKNLSLWLSRIRSLKRPVRLSYAALAVIIMTGCGSPGAEVEGIISEETVSRNAVSNINQANASSKFEKKISLPEGDFPQLKEHNFFKSPRPENMYALLYAADHEICGALLTELNKKGDSVGIITQPTTMIKALLGTKFSVDWLVMNGGDWGRYYVETDLDHDGKAENVFRKGDRVGSNIIQHITLLPYSFVYNSDLDINTYFSQVQKSYTREHGRIKDEWFHGGTIDFGASTYVAPQHRSEHGFGQFIEIVELYGKGYLLLGGASEGFADATVPVRVLKRNIQNDEQHKLYSSVCEFRPRYRQIGVGKNYNQKQFESIVSRQ